MQRCSQERWIKSCIQRKGLLDHDFVKPLRCYRIQHNVPTVQGDRGGDDDEGVLVQKRAAMALLALAGGAGYQLVGVGRVSAIIGLACLRARMANRVPLD